MKPYFLIKLNIRRAGAERGEKTLLRIHYRVVSEMQCKLFALKIQDLRVYSFLARGKIYWSFLSFYT